MQEVSLSHNINTTEGKTFFFFSDQDRNALSLRVLTVISSQMSTLIFLISLISQKVSLELHRPSNSLQQTSINEMHILCTYNSELQNCQSNFTKNVGRIKCLKRQSKDRAEECFNFEKTGYQSQTFILREITLIFDKFL